MLGGELLNQPNPAIALVFVLLFGHFLADYPLQGDFIAGWKDRNMPPPVGLPKTLWFHCLTAHAFIHGGFVFLFTGSIFLGLLEVLLHWIIDFIKCEKWINFHIDQILHVSCKLLYVFLLTR